LPSEILSLYQTVNALMKRVAEKDYQILLREKSKMFKDHLGILIPTITGRSKRQLQLLATIGIGADDVVKIAGKSEYGNFLAGNVNIKLCNFNNDHYFD
jgi:hypothetical protein